MSGQTTVTFTDTAEFWSALKAAHQRGETVIAIPRTNEILLADDEDEDGIAPPPVPAPTAGSD